MSFISGQDDPRRGEERREWATSTSYNLLDLQQVGFRILFFGIFFVFRTLLETLGGRGYVENLSSIVDNFNEKKPDVNLETPV